MRSLLVALSSCAAGQAAALGIVKPMMPKVWSSWAFARRANVTDECTVDWLGSDNETTFETNLALLTNIPNKQDTLTGANIFIHFAHDFLCHI